MPCARISLLRGRSPEYLRAVADSLQRALEESFEVPLRDHFQVIEQLEREEFVFDRDYLGRPRSEAFVLFTITAGRTRTLATKRAFYRRLCELLALAPGIDSRDVMIVITTTSSEDWSFGGGIATLAPVEEGR